MTEDAKRRAAGIEMRQEMDAREDASRYLKARLILNDLREKMRFGKISYQQYATLRGQALAGDVDGSVRGLAKVLRKNSRWEA